MTGGYDVKIDRFGEDDSPVFIRQRSTSEPTLSSPEATYANDPTTFRRQSSPAILGLQTQLIDLGDLDDFEDLEDIEECKKVACRRASVRGILVDELSKSLEGSVPLSRLDAGQTGGVYVVPREPQDGAKAKASSASILAVFKPESEEGFARRGIPHGGGAMREEAAYMVDRLVGQVARVPVTVRARVPAKKVHNELLPNGQEEQTDVSAGAVQRFVQDLAGASEDFGMPQNLEAAAKVVDVAAAQHVASLDIRMCNTDRHPGNLLFKRREHDHDVDTGDCTPSTFLPIPIDHGCTLPQWWAMGEATFDAWAGWPQVRAAPLPEVLETIRVAYANRHETVNMLSDLGLEPASQATYWIGVTLLHEGVVRHGLSLAVVAGLMSRDPYDIGEPSWLELQFEQCADSTGADWTWETNDYGDKVACAPANVSAWPPDVFLEKLESVFSSDSTRDAGQLWAEEKYR